MSEPADTPAEVEPIRDEAARQAIRLMFSVAGVLVMIAAQRAASDPDFYRTVRMRLARSAEKIAARAAAVAWKVAERARVTYQQESA